MPKVILMCPPTYFDIEYEINPWMNKSNQVSSDLALKQWEILRSIYVNQFGWEVKLIKPIDGLPDMVFTANGGLVIDKKVALPTFRAPDRQPETAYFRTWFESNGYSEFLQPKYDFEGEGDCLIWNDIIFAGYPWRSDKASHSELASYFNKQVISLQMSDARFYHLDTCLTIVNADSIAIWPPAFTEESIEKLRGTVPNIIEASERDAMAYGLNAMSDGKHIVLSEGAADLIQKYKAMGMEVATLPISEFQKSGGGVKCLTLQLS